MIAALERAEIPSVYLRNYENLPAAVGNDVDLLLPPGRTNQAVEVIERVASENGWRFLSRARFGPLAVYVANLDTAETLHLDLFERLDWHFLEIADAARVLERRRFNGTVHIPAEEDEIYLNLAGRLAYQGLIRERHRIQASAHVERYGEEGLAGAFTAHIGSQGTALFHNLLREGWEPDPCDRSLLLKAALRQHGLRKPTRLAGGIVRYATRIVQKLVNPPGHFIVLEGADGVGKSTVLDAILPWIPEWCAGRKAYDFHWKPVTLRSGKRIAAPPVDPRSNTPRSSLASFAYLAFHLLGFWWGWLIRIRPLLAKSHCVVGDRYSYDLFLDPKRFRLKLPDWTCRLAALLAPSPSVTVGLFADPTEVHERKPELTAEEISTYQQRWRSLATGRRNMVSVSASGSPEEVTLRVKKSILRAIARHERR